MGRMADDFKILALYSCGHRGFLLAHSNEEAHRLADLAGTNLCPPCELLRVGKAAK
jgi:hypothetical protein